MQYNNAESLVSDILLKADFSSNKTVREVACDICEILLKKLKEKFGGDQVEFCMLFAFLDWRTSLKLKGAAGFQPYGMQREEINSGEGILGKVAQDKKPIITHDLRNDAQIGKGFEQDLAQLADKVALFVHPLILSSGQLVGVLALGKFSNSSSTQHELFNSPEFKETIAQFSKQIATIHNHAVILAKAWRSKKYTHNERNLAATVKLFYRNHPRSLDTKKFMDYLAVMLMKILNAGNPETPFYRNYLFYEYQPYRERYILRSYGSRPGDRPSFSQHSPIYRDYIADGLVKSVESQAKFVQNRGREPHIIRHIKNKVEEIEERLAAKWSPCGSGSAFIVPLFEDKRRLGVLVFLSRYQNRQYVNCPPFYLGPERRQTSLYDLKVFRSLQPLIANEYFKLRVDEERQRRIEDLESILGAVKEIILLEDQREVLERLAKFTAQSLNCEGCLIYLATRGKSQLELSAVSGFQIDPTLKKDFTFPLSAVSDQHPSPPVQIFNMPKPIIINRGLDFRRFCGNQEKFGPFFKQLRSGRVISYLGQSIGNIGVMEVFNKSKLTPRAWSFFEEQDVVALRHISEAIATVLNRMEATASQVQSEKMKVVNELLLDISHELKNPLYSSLIFVRRLKESLSGQKSFTAENGALEPLALVEKNIEKAQRILRSMQSSQNIIMGQTNLQPVNLEKIIRMVVQTNTSFCEQQRITIGTKFWAREPFVYGDELQLNQVFTNLVKNAIDAMPQGGMLTVCLYDWDDDTLRAEITDTGSGIPEAIKNRVFEPFVTTKDSNNGAGLGLALSQRIIKQHKGTIEFETKLGWGTKFLVTLPKYTEAVFPHIKQIGR